MLDLKVPSLALCFFALSACGNEVVVDDGSTGGAPGSGVSGPSGKTSSTTKAATTSTSTGAGGIGEPSNIYPAPHSAPPTVANLGGPVLTAPNVIPIFFQNDDPTLKAGALSFLQKVGSTAYWTATTSEYGVGPATTSALITLNETPPAQIDDSQIQAWLTGKLNANDPSLPAADANKLYTIFYPSNVAITLDNGDGTKAYSCQAFGGYHSNATLDAAHGSLAFAYAVIPRCGSFGPFSGIDGLTAPASHELIEAATDPLPMSIPAFGQTDEDHLAWTIALGGEVGDLCAQLPDAFTNFPGFDNIAQRSWSNAAALAGHDPCVPVPPGQVYFNAAPKLTENITLFGGYQTKGVKIPVGQSKTIDVNLFSDGPTNGPFPVEAYDAGQSDLSLSFDQDSGENGQTLHLTIEVLGKGQYGFETFYLFSNLNGRRTMWVGAVGN